jgi:hypothetical protein
MASVIHRFRRLSCHPVRCADRAAERTRAMFLSSIVGARDHLMLAHTLLAQVLQPGDTALDATCGNGLDARFVAGLVLRPGMGRLVCMDVQGKALVKTKEILNADMLDKYGASETDYILQQQVQLVLQNHRDFPDDIAEGTVAAIVYNLGYLPGGDKALKTNHEDTIESLAKATRLVKVKGIISILAYRGHDGGPEETAAVEAFVSSLPSFQWSVYRHCPLNRPVSPILFSVYRNS